MGLSYEKVHQKVESLHEFNPMLGFRGCRLGIIYPEITEMQARAIFEAAAEVRQAGGAGEAEGTIPPVGHLEELAPQAEDGGRAGGGGVRGKGRPVPVLGG